MQDIQGLQDGDDNMGSVLSVRFAPESGVTHLNDVASGLLAVDCLRNDSVAAQLYRLRFTADTGELKITGSVGENGPEWKVEISVLVPKDYEYMMPALGLMDGNKFFVFTQSYNKKTWLHGYINVHDEKYCMTFNSDFTTGVQRAGRNGFLLKFSYVATKRPRTVTYEYLGY